MFEKTLLDLVKGLRTNKDNPSAFISQCVKEIRHELNTGSHDIKAQAVLKLSHIYMLGYDISWAGFKIVEVMSQPTFEHRRIAFLAASMCFREQDEILVLTTHLFKKVFSNTRQLDGSQYMCGCAIGCLTNIVTPDLAHNLCQDVFVLCNCSRPYLRKKAVLALYAFFKKFPQGLRAGFPRIRERLEDPDPGVQTSAVNVICELARRNPKNYLNLAPILYKLLNTSGNNWMLIKLVKLMGNLMKLEPRLIKKMQEPLKSLITTTPAKSLLYECIYTATQDSAMSRSMVAICLEKLRGFIEDPDQNLKYLGLLGLNRIMVQNSKAVGSYKELVIACLDDSDVTIRRRALDLLVNMVSRKNLEDIVQKLEMHLKDSEGDYREHVLRTLITVCSQDDYSRVEDFLWYIRLLRSLAGLPSMNQENAELICNNLMDVVIRVKEVRDHGVEHMEELLIESELVGSAHIHANHVSRVLYAAAYLTGEFAAHVKNHISVIRALLDKRLTCLPPNVQCVFIHSAFKVTVGAISQEFDDDDLYKSYTKELLQLTVVDMMAFKGSAELEVQERATTAVFVLEWLQEQARGSVETLRQLAKGLWQVFEQELIPVHRRAQRKVQLPKGLLLDKWINQPLPDSEDEKDPLLVPMDVPINLAQDSSAPYGRASVEDLIPKSFRKMSKAEMKLAKERQAARAHKNKNDPYIITGDVVGVDGFEETEMSPDYVNQIPIEKLPTSFLPLVQEKSDSDGAGYSKKKRKKKKVRYTVQKVLMNIGSDDSDGEEAARKKKRRTAADLLSEIDLTGLAKNGEVETLPGIKAYERQTWENEMKKKAKEEKRKKREDRRKDKKRRKHKRKKKKKKDKRKDLVKNETILESKMTPDKLIQSSKPEVTRSNSFDLLGIGTQQNPVAKSSKTVFEPLPGLEDDSAKTDFDFLGGFGSPTTPTHHGDYHKPPPPVNAAPVSSPRLPGGGRKNSGIGAELVMEKGKTKEQAAEQSVKLSTGESLLFSNGDITISYCLKSKKSTLSLVVRVEVASKENMTVKKVTLNIEPSKQFRFKHELIRKSKRSSGTVSLLLSRKLRSGTKKTNKINLGFSELSGPESIPCSLSYERDGGAKVVLNGELVFHAVGYFVSSKVSPERLRDILSDKDLCGCKVTQTLPSTKMANKALLTSLRKQLKLSKIDGNSSSKGTFYQKLAGGNHMALQVKGSKTDVSLSLRATTHALAEDLMDSIKELIVI